MKHLVTLQERALLRRQHITSAGLATLHAEAVSALTDIELERCHYLIAMAALQSLGSVGPAAAQDLWDVGCRNLHNLSRRDPLDMIAQLTLLAGPQDQSSQLKKNIAF